MEWRKLNAKLLSMSKKFKFMINLVRAHETMRSNSVNSPKWWIVCAFERWIETWDDEMLDVSRRWFFCVLHFFETKNYYHLSLMCISKPLQYSLTSLTSHFGCCTHFHVLFLLLFLFIVESFFLCFTFIGKQKKINRAYGEHKTKN